MNLWTQQQKCAVPRRELDVNLSVAVPAVNVSAPVTDFKVHAAGGISVVERTSRWPLMGWWVVRRHHRLGPNAYVVHTIARCWTRRGAKRVMARGEA